MRELNLPECFMDDTISRIVDAIEKCIALGESEIFLIHGHIHGDIIKRWIWSP